MLMGQYDYAIDAKGRLNFPARFREEMGENFVVTRWIDDWPIIMMATAPIILNGS